MSAAVEPPEDDETDVGMVWLRTEPDLDGVYRVSLEVNEDTSEFLDRDGARLWAEYVLIQASRAEHDAKVLKQLTASGNQAAALEVLGHLRKDRVEPISPTALTLSVGVTKEGKGFLKVIIDGEQRGQWELDQAQTHAAVAIQAIYMADLDGAYRAALVNFIGLDDQTARVAVDGLQTYG